MAFPLLLYNIFNFIVSCFPADKLLNAEANLDPSLRWFRNENTDCGD